MAQRLYSRSFPKLWVHPRLPLVPDIYVDTSGQPRQEGHGILQVLLLILFVLLPLGAASVHVQKVASDQRQQSVEGDGGCL
eukprot:scaffold257_cov422-Prasinococcus_capsulatus_cf.AAC.5